MENSMIKILFVISKSRINKAGLAPLYCRLTFLDKRKEFATGLFIKPENWHNVKQCAIPPNEENKYINTQLSLIANKVNQAFLFLQVQLKDFDVDDIYNQHRGKKIQKEYSVLEIFDLHIEKQKKLIGISTTKVSVAKFLQTKKHVATFIQYKYNTAVQRKFFKRDLN